MNTISVLNIDGKEVEKLKVDEKVFDGSVNSNAVHQSVSAYLTNKRRGTAATKTRKEVSGGGKRPWRQKGTGRARASSIRSPLWRGGGVVFGPHPKDYNSGMLKQVKRLALRSCLNDKFNDKGIVIIDEIKFENNKTKEFLKLLKKLKIDAKVLFLVGSKEAGAGRAARNISRVCVCPTAGVNAYDVINSRKVLLSLDSFKELTKRLK